MTAAKVTVTVLFLLLSLTHHVGAGVLLRRHAGSLCGYVGLLLLLLGAAAWLTVPVDPDEAVVENSLDAGDGPPGLLVFGVLDQCRLRVSTKHHLEEDRGDSVTPTLASI